MGKLHRLSLVVLLLGAWSASGAETVKMQGAQGVEDESRPTRGMTQQRVESRFGAPDAKIAPVGDPPISRWEYEDFVVFFEYDRVIHAVVKR